MNEQIYRAEVSDDFGITEDGCLITGVKLVPTDEDVFSMLDEELSNVGSELLDYLHADTPIVVGNLYRVVSCNETIDWETGYVDGYDLKIVRHK